MAVAPSTTMQVGSSPVVTTTMAMKSIFTQPPDCASSWTFEPFKYNNWYPGILMQNCGAVVSSCFPSGFANTGRLSASVIYSPGYCPVGYTSVDSTVSGETTTATCCYSNFSYTTSAQIDSHSVTASFAGCTSMLSSVSSTAVPTAGGEDAKGQGTTQLTGPILMWAQPITILYRSSDSALLASGPTTTTSAVTKATSAFTTTTSASMTATAASTTASRATSQADSQPTSKTTVPVSQSATNTSGPDSDTKHTPSTVSMAAIAGIGIAAGVIAFLIVAMFFWWFWRRRRSKGGDSGVTETPSRKQQYLCDVNTGSAKQLYELHSDSRYVGPSELDGTTARVSKYMPEMPG